jgi:hypothetical protein
MPLAGSITRSFLLKEMSLVPVLLELSSKWPCRFNRMSIRLSVPWGLACTPLKSLPKQESTSKLSEYYTVKDLCQCLQQLIKTWCLWPQAQQHPPRLKLYANLYTYKIKPLFHNANHQKTRWLRLFKIWKVRESCQETVNLVLNYNLK